MPFRLTLIFLILLTACAAPAASSATGTPTTPPPAIPSLTPTTAPTRTSAFTPTAHATGTSTPTPMPTRTPAVPLAHLAAGQPVTITRLDMIDKNNGWAAERHIRRTTESGMIEYEDHILRTTDGGDTWLDVSPPEQGFRMGAALDAQTAWAVPTGDLIVVADAQNNLMAMSHALALTWRTTDGGRTWQPGKPFSIARIQQGSFLGEPMVFGASLQMFDAQTGYLFLSVDCDNHGSCGWQLYHTANGGYTWERVNDSDGTPYNPLLVSVYFADQSTGWGASGLLGWGSSSTPTLYQTTDGGRNWKPITLSYPAQLPPGFENAEKECETQGVFNDGSGITVRSECMLHTDSYPRYSFYHRSMDGGKTWNAGQTAALYASGINFIDAKTGWQLISNASGSYELLQTTDGGNTWTTLRHVIWTGDLHFLNASDGYILAYFEQSRALLVTHDGGKTWREIKPVIGK